MTSYNLWFFIFYKNIFWKYFLLEIFLMKYCNSCNTFICYRFLWRRFCSVCVAAAVIRINIWENKYPSNYNQSCSVLSFVSRNTFLGAKVIDTKYNTILQTFQIFNKIAHNLFIIILSYFFCIWDTSISFLFLFQ